MKYLLLLLLAFISFQFASATILLSVISSDITGITISLELSISPKVTYEFYMKEIDESIFQLVPFLERQPGIISIERYKNTSLLPTRYAVKAVVTFLEGEIVESKVLELNLEQPTSASKSSITFDEKTQMETLNVIVQTVTETGSLKTKGGDLVYMMIKSYDSKGVISNSISRQDIVMKLLDNNNGTYTGKYEINEKGRILDISIFLIRKHRSYNIELSPNDVFNNKLKNEENLWLMKIMVPEERTYNFRMLVNGSTKLYVNGLSILQSPKNSSDPYLHGEYCLKKNIVYDFIIENFNPSEMPNLEWDFPMNYTSIEPGYWWSFEQIGKTHSVKVNCGSHHYMSFERKCKRCDFRCFTCSGEGVSSCLTCDLEKEGVLNESSQCKCGQGYIPEASLERCVRTMDSLMSSREWRYTNATLNSKTILWQLLDLHEDKLMDDIKGKERIRSYLINDNKINNYKRINGRLLEDCPSDTPATDDPIDCPVESRNATTDECISCPPGQQLHENKCIPCPIGKYKHNPGGHPCANCKEGTYNPCLGAPSCRNCPKGTYNLLLGLSSVTNCQLCEAGTHNPNTGSKESAACVPCEAGRYNPDQGKAECTECPAGTYNNKTGSINSADCVPCEMGTYNPGSGKTECIKCPVGTYNNKTGSIDSADCSQCEAGTHNNQTGQSECVKCAAGTYVNAKGKDNCVNCPIGMKNPEEGKEACEDCLPGTYSNTTGKTKCNNCPRGFYSTVPKSITIADCKACPEGKYNSYKGQDSPDKCLNCPLGSYNNKTGQMNCTNCSKGYYNEESGSINIGNCLPCPVGTYSSVEGLDAKEKCKPCPEGTYNNETGQEVCKNCPKGYYSNQTRLTEESQCVACPEGTYNSEEGQKFFDNCSACPPGSYNNNTGQISCTNCPKGHYNEKSGSINSTDCLECLVGTYNPHEGKGPAESCLNCTVGTYNDLTGQRRCKPCPKGSYSDQLGLKEETECTLCPIGTYNPDTGKNSSTDCLECPIGTFGGTKGMTGCTPCHKGYYSNTTGLISADNCTKCPLGTFNPVEGKIYLEDCFSCPNGTYNDEEGQEGCKPCPMGTYSNQTKLVAVEECASCPKGTYNPDVNRTSIIECKDCPEGTYNDEERNETCKLCPKGFYSNRTRLEAVEECAACDIGTYNPEEGQKSITNCLNCSAGTYNNLTGQENCTLCPKGHYTNETGSIAEENCTACPIGTYNPFEGQDSIAKCLDCPIGSYNDELGQDNCTDCLPGTANPELGGNSSSVCIKCKILFYNPLPRQSTCLPCEEMKFNTYEGATECIDCNRLCNSCYGLTNNDCHNCTIDVDYLDVLKATRCSCLSGYFDDRNKTIKKDYCQPCHEYCRECYDTYDNCLSCIRNTGISFRDSKCICDVPAHYEKVNGTRKECLRCHPLCLRCDGSLNTQCDECDLDTGAGFVSPRTCICPSHSYYDEYMEKCIVCNGLCMECFGPSNYQCHGCNTALALRVVNENNTCVSDCGLLPRGYYRDISICKPCHEDCLTCTGPTNTTCLTCSSPQKVMYRYECINNCPTHHVAVSGVCFECYITCQNCSGISIDKCLSCISGYFLWKGECLTKCPSGTYHSSDASIGNICVACPTGCKTCLDDLTCTSCSKMYYLTKQNCVQGEKCPDISYPDETTRRCENCFETCLNCIGGTSKDCTTCDYKKGYKNNPGEDGECYLVVCAEGTYLNINHLAGVAECPVCHDLCKTCSGGGSTDCITCAKDTITVITSTGTVCKKCPKGYKITEDGQCQEICGDGLNLGKYECDDGNNVNGDGCSAECTIEEGFRCNHNLDSADTCVDIRSPKAVLTIRKGSTLIVTFSELVLIKANSTFFISKMQVFLKDNCQLTWSLQSTFNTNQKFTQLNIDTQPECSLRSGANFFIVHFTEPSLITDIAGNELANPKLEAKTMRYTYINENDQAYSGGVGTILNSSSVITLGFMIFMSLFQSVDSGCFWSFVNMAQMISYLPAIECELPYTLELVLTKYLNVKKLAIPWDMLPAINFNPLAFLEPFLTNPLSDKFVMAGYDSLSFIYNFADELSTWLLIGGFYLLLMILCSIIPKKKYNSNIIIDFLQYIDGRRVMNIMVSYELL